LRLNVYLQRAGIGSRREAERLVAEGRVSVNGAVALPTTPVNDGDEVKVSGQRVALDSSPLPRLFKLYKPLDVICTTRDHKDRPTIFDLPAMKKRKLPRLMNVGRLDINSEGLLLMSSDGPLAQAMMKPATALPRVYRVRVRGKLRDEDIAKLAQGIMIDGIKYRPAEILEDTVYEGRANAWYRVILREGKNREVRKLMEHFGCVVNRLIRTHYGPFEIGTLKAGEMEEIPLSSVKEFIHSLREQGAIPPQ
jgi:23S rRNA pseudouridine2605 synthase